MARSWGPWLLVGVVAIAAATVAGGGADAPARAEDVAPAIPAPDASAEAVEARAWRERRPYASFLITGLQRGNLLPCGCTRPKTGGVERLATLVDRLRRRPEDGGWAGLSFGWVLAGRGEPQEESKASLLRALFQELGLSASFLGVPDLYVASMAQPFEASPGEAMTTSAGLDVPRPPINVRLRDASPASGTQPIADFRVRDLKVRAFLVVDPEPAQRLLADGIAHVAISTTGAVQSLQPGPDTLWIVGAYLSGTQRDDLRTGLARLGPSVVVDLARESGAERLPPTRLGSTPVVVSFDELGKTVGVLDVDPVPEAEGGGWSVSYRTVPLVPDLDALASPLRDDVVRPLLARYRQEVRESGYLRDFAATFADEGATRYVGSARCAGCHPGIYEEWSATRHAVALDTLAAMDHAHDPECVRCHVVGFERMADDRFTRTSSGFLDPARTAHLGGVGCENCHGPGSVHVARPTDPTVWEPGPGRRNARSPGIAECQRCHDAENSPGFPEGFADRHLPAVDHRNVPADRRTVLRERRTPR
jgi:hypothetical protein